MEKDDPLEKSTPDAWMTALPPKRNAPDGSLQTECHVSGNPSSHKEDRKV